MSCKMCTDSLHGLLLTSQKIGKVLSVEGDDMTNEFFRELNVLRRTIKTIEFEKEKTNV